MLRYSVILTHQDTGTCVHAIPSTLRENANQNGFIWDKKAVCKLLYYSMSLDQDFTVLEVISTMGYSAAASVDSRWVVMSQLDKSQFPCHIHRSNNILMLCFRICGDNKRQFVIGLEDFSEPPYWSVSAFVDQRSLINNVLPLIDHHFDHLSRNLLVFRWLPGNSISSRLSLVKVVDTIKKISKRNTINQWKRFFF